jgi:hypothetical protein
MIKRAHPLFDYEIDRKQKEITIYEYMPNVSDRTIEGDIEYVIQKLYQDVAEEVPDKRVNLNEYTITYPRETETRHTRTRIRVQNGDIAEVVTESFEGKRKWRFKI